MQKEQIKLRTLHHSEIRRILDITWEQVREENITNEEIRWLFYKIHKLDAFLMRCIVKYIGKAY